MQLRHSIMLLLLPLCLTAKGTGPASDNTESSKSDNTKKEKREHVRVFTGFSGGMMVHIGYAFSSTPDELFRNGSVKDIEGLPKDGVTLGIGGAARIHLLDHIHIGGEGYVSTMPLMRSGSNVRMGWGGVLCDYYFHIGKRVRPLIGMTIGGGSMKRLYVPEDAETVTGNQTTYNASYTKTPFFLLDPYVGLEIGLTKHIALITRVDYMLPFGKKGTGLVDTDVSWSNFITPSGPRLYVGFMFGH